jgi:hypothetical protein
MQHAAVEKAQSDSAKGRFKVSEDAAKKLAGSPIKDLELVKKLLADGSLDYRDLRGYLATGEVKRLVEALAKDDGLFNVYREALRVPGVTKLIAEFLESKEGIDSFVMMGRNENGLRLLIKLGQVAEGRDVAKHMLHSAKGWLAIYRIMKGLEQASQETENRAAKVPSIDLSHFAKSGEPAKEILPLLRNPGTAGAAFASLSENRENAGLCCRVLGDSEVRKAIFGHLTEDPLAAVGTFRELLASEERRGLMKQIFKSEGGKELLLELAGDATGRTIITSLATVPEARKMGLGIMINPRNWILAGKLAVTFFREPVTGVEKEEVVQN